LVAVGMPVTRHPPHRSQRALLTHWAPASGNDVQAQVRLWMMLVSTISLSYPFQCILQARHPKSFPAQRPELVLLEQIPLGQSPSLHGLLRQDSHLSSIGPFLGIYGPVRLPTSVHRSRTPLGFPARTVLPLPQGQRWDLPVGVFGNERCACSGLKISSSSRSGQGPSKNFRSRSTHWQVNKESKLR